MLSLTASAVASDVCDATTVTQLLLTEWALNLLSDISRLFVVKACCEISIAVWPRKHCQEAEIARCIKPFAVFHLELRPSNPNLDLDESSKEQALLFAIKLKVYEQLRLCCHQVSEDFPNRIQGTTATNMFLYVNLNTCFFLLY